ncbi:MAG: SMI1/KNR4 family protein [Oscillospiraceae bacterium]|nr:SMI1/KNR4 family protein [Oscillospiraceae bacterium]
MKSTLTKLKNLLERAGISNIINSPISLQDIIEWEKTHNVIIPEEIKDFLQFSNGFEYNWGSLVIFQLNRIKVITGWDSVPDGWLFLGSVIGDGAYLVSDVNGDLYLDDHENPYQHLRRISLKEWIERHTIISIEEEYDVE